MTVANRNIVDTYGKMLEGLHLSTKLKIAENLIASMECVDTVNNAYEFFLAFGTWKSERSMKKLLMFSDYQRRFAKKILGCK